MHFLGLNLRWPDLQGKAWARTAWDGNLKSKIGVRCTVACLSLSQWLSQGLGSRLRCLRPGC
jgi:hypothetical protein